MLAERRVVDRATANSLAAGGHGPRQDGQGVKAKLPSGGCLRHWSRAWGQRELACEGTSRSRGSARRPSVLKGGLDFPDVHGSCESLSLDTRISRWRTALDHALVELDFLPRAQRIGP